MTRYSHTRLSQFENCRFAYDLHYNKGYVSPFTTVEAFMGSRVHETMEKLYRDLEDGRLDSKDELIAYYLNRWDEEYEEPLIINNSQYSDLEMKDIGVDCICNYYDAKHPFDQTAVAGIETDDEMALPDGNTWSVRIDRFGFRGNTFYVCDYKTNGRMKTQYEADTDRQLAMYAAWVKQKYGSEKRVKLVWHMLRFGQDVESERTWFEIQDCVNGAVKSIREIESCDDWSPNESPLCGWCVYKHKCPKFVEITDSE